MATAASFGLHTPSQTVVDAFPERVKGKIFAVTGPTPEGISGPTLTALASAAPRALVLIGRTPSKFASVVKQITTIDASIKVVVVQADLASLASVRAAAQAILDNPDVPHIDVLINNAGVMACPHALTVDGFETQFATNHLAHFLLTALLWPKLKAAGTPRIVNVSSSGHRFGHGDFSDHSFKQAEYSEFVGYGQSKLANVYFSNSLASRGVEAFSLHPGSIATGLQVYVTPEVREKAMKIATNMESFEPRERKTLDEGASTTLVAALDPALSAGSYLSDCQVYEPSEAARDTDKAEKLWELSETLVGQKFSI